MTDFKKFKIIGIDKVAIMTNIKLDDEIQFSEGKKEFINLYSFCVSFQELKEGDFIEINQDETRKNYSGKIFKDNEITIRKCETNYQSQAQIVSLKD